MDGGGVGRMVDPDFRGLELERLRATAAASGESESRFKLAEPLEAIDMCLNAVSCCCDMLEPHSYGAAEMTYFKLAVPEFRILQLLLKLNAS